ncbi:DNA-binding response OmpR family regulator [Rhizobium petrolearium]|uniref:response regulator transcription factor n=1 Tax=Neorhizobium petrolearium TaxID=515361 RepID=UPI001AE3246C|nr:response regulator transcription factor [Neorhizobium petrolearium]MBP1847437.1 DNA-binding response OmpR family regulator [Neorhizobium petrolearium]
MRLLLAEDDPLIARDIVAQLSKAGYVVTHEKDGEAAWFAGEHEDFAAVILDLGLPKLDGLTILKRWRANGRNIPVIILTARGNWEERVEGIDAGADDYLSKPFRMPELLARLRAVLRRYAGQANPILSSGPISIDTRQKTVMVDDLLVEVSPLEYRCIAVLMQNRDRAVSQMELTEQLYAQDFERESNSVEVLVGRLRKKLGKDAILTRRGFGYQIAQDEAT